MTGGGRSRRGQGGYLTHFAEMSLLTIVRRGA